MKKLLYALSSIALTASVTTPVIYFALRDDETEVPETIISKKFSYSNDLATIKNGGDDSSLVGTHELETTGLENVIKDIKKTGKDLKSNKYKLTEVETKLGTTTSSSLTPLNPHFDINKFNELIKFNFIEVDNQRLEIYKSSTGSAQEEYNFTLLADFKVKNVESDNYTYFKNVRVTEMQSYKPYSDLGQVLKLHQNTLTIQYTIIIDINAVDSGPDVGIKLPEVGIIYYVSHILQRFNGSAQNPPNPQDQQIAQELQSQILAYINRVHDINLSKIDTPITEVWSAVLDDDGKYTLGELLESNYELKYEEDPYFYLAITSKTEAIGTHYVLIANSKSEIN